MDINTVFALLLFFAFVGMMRARGMGRRQRELQETITHLKSAQFAAPRPAPGPTKEQVERLEERLRVLERIVTDRGYNLAAEIEALRDQRPLPARTASHEVERNS